MSRYTNRQLASLLRNEAKARRVTGAGRWLEQAAENLAGIEGLKVELRNALADYMESEGCSCCRSIERHKVNAERLAKLLDVPPYDDHSGFDFTRYNSRRSAERDD